LNQFIETNIHIPIGFNPTRVCFSINVAIGIYEDSLCNSGIIQGLFSFMHS